MPPDGWGARITFGMIAQPHFVRTLTVLRAHLGIPAGGRYTLALMSVTLGQASKSGRSTQKSFMLCERLESTPNYAMSGLLVWRKR